MNSKIGGVAAAFGFIFSLIIGLISGNGVFALIRALILAVFFFVLVNILLVIIRRFLPELLDFDLQTGEDYRPGSRVNITEGVGPAAILGGEAGLESLGSRQDQGGMDGGSVAEPDLSSERFSYNDDAGGGQGSGGGELSGFDAATPAGLGAMPPPVLGNLSGLSVPSDENSPDGVPSPGLALDQGGKDGYNREKDVSASGAGPRMTQTGGAEFSPQPALREDAVLPDDNSSVDVLPDLEAMSQAFLASTREADTAGIENETTGQTEDVFRLSVTGQEPDPSSRYYTGNKPVEMEGDFPPKQLAQAIQTVLKRDEQ
ncbi:MAG: hypothetical protein LBF77_04150 [Spirochaetaceae bacterium]|jgi:hypothetical protein|nr:hypothetical protein [Spirochaetaceae bacterium]